MPVLERHPARPTLWTDICSCEACCSALPGPRPTESMSRVAQGLYWELRTSRVWTFVGWLWILLGVSPYYGIFQN
jgi:hypothetical protein